MVRLHLRGRDVDRRLHLLLEGGDARLEGSLVRRELDDRRVARAAHERVARHHAVRVARVQQRLHGKSAPLDGLGRLVDLGEQLEKPARLVVVERLAVRALHGHVVEAEEEETRGHLAVGQHVFDLLLALHLVERRLGEVHVALLNQLRHLAVEEREEERADVGAVHVGIGHDDDLVVADLRDVPLLREAAADRGDKRADLVVREHAVDARLLHVQHLAAERQDRLRGAVAARRRRAAGGVALHEEQLCLGRVALGAVLQLAGEREAVHHALAHGLARLARGLAGAERHHDLVDHGLRHGGVLLEERHELLAHDGVHDALHLAVAELRLRLALELRLRHLHAHDHREALAHVVSRDGVLLLDAVLHRAAVLVDGARERGAEAREVRAALDRVDVVAVGLLDGGIGVRVLHGHLSLHRARHALRLALEVDHGRERLLVRVEELGELVDAALVVERLLVVAFALIVPEVDLHALVEERELAQAAAEDLPLERVAAEDGVVGEERHLRARLVAAFADDGERLRHVAARELDVVDLAVALHLHLHPVGKRVHAAHAHAVQSARHLVVRAVELAARVQDREHHLDRGTVLRGMHVHGDAAPVVRHGERAVGIDLHVDERAVPRERLVDRVVHHLVDEMVVASFARVADVHGGALAHGLHAFQHLNVGGVVIACLLRLGRFSLGRLRLFF